MDSVEQAIIATDLQGRIIYWNHQAEKLYGLGEGEAIGQNIIEATMSEISKAQGAEMAKSFLPIFPNRLCWMKKAKSSA